MGFVPQPNLLAKNFGEGNVYATGMETVSNYDIAVLFYLCIKTLTLLGNSGATPRRRQTQAVRPRAADRRKGMLTKRGNAHQESKQGIGNRREFQVFYLLFDYPQPI